MKKPIKPTAKKPTPTKTPVKKFQAGGGNKTTTS